MVATALPGSAAPPPGEDWPGPGGGGAQRNASAVDVDPRSAVPLWRRSFAAVPFGDQEGPADEMHLAGARGSRNLAVVDGRVALLAADGTGFPEAFYLTVLDAAAGTTVNCVQVRANIGNTRVYLWPYHGVSMSTDMVTGWATLHWDPETGLLFTGQGAYQSGMTAYRPLANAATHRSGAWQVGVPAYAEVAAAHPGLEDAFGRTRAEQRTRLGVNHEPVDGLQPWAWGLSGIVPRADDERQRYDADWETLFGRQGSSWYNTSCQFAVDPAGGLAGTVKGADWGHNIAGDVYLFSKYTGMKAVAAWPAEPRPRLAPEASRLRPFASGGLLLHGGRVYAAGPAEDRDGDGQLGVRRPEGLLPKVDQGLALWGYEVAWEDRRANDGATGPAAVETAVLRPLFHHERPSAYAPDPADIDSYGQSYFETDGFHRPKALLVDGGGALWCAWKPDEAGPVELVRAGPDGAAAWPLEVGRGSKGVDLWPRLSLARVEGRDLLVYWTGWARHRPRWMPASRAEAEAELRQWTHKGNRWEELSAADRENVLDRCLAVGMWTGELREPRGAAGLAVFDPAAGRVRWTHDVSARFPGLPANDFWTALDETQMVVAGRWAWVGWVETPEAFGAEAVLRLTAYDLAAEDAARFVTRTIPLGFPAEGNRRSVLADLVAADGRLFALVYQSDRLEIRDPRWEAQHVLAFGAAP